MDLSKKHITMDIDTVFHWIAREYDNAVDECKRFQDTALIRAYNEGQLAAFRFVTDLLRMLEESDATQSVEPEIIRCENCKYYGCNECFHARGLVGATDNGFCSMAERKEK